MLKQPILGLLAIISNLMLPPTPVAELVSPLPDHPVIILAEHRLDLKNRAPNEAINEVFKYNILLASEKLGGSFSLEPGEVFVFHDQVLPEFKNQPLKPSGTRYTAKEGYQTTLGLPGNGVCHLASLMNWTASEAGLGVTAKVGHNFAPIPDVPEEFGTSIRYCHSGCNAANQNLYIKNPHDFPVEFVFERVDEAIRLKIFQSSFE